MFFWLLQYETKWCTNMASTLCQTIKVSQRPTIRLRRSWSKNLQHGRAHRLVFVLSASVERTLNMMSPLRFLVLSDYPGYSPGRLALTTSITTRWESLLQNNRLLYFSSIIIRSLSDDQALTDVRAPTHSQYTESPVTSTEHSCRQTETEWTPKTATETLAFLCAVRIQYRKKLVSVGEESTTRFKSSMAISSCQKRYQTTPPCLSYRSFKESTGFVFCLCRVAHQH